MKGEREEKTERRRVVVDTAVLTSSSEKARARTLMGKEAVLGFETVGRTENHSDLLGRKADLRRVVADAI